MSMSRLYDLAFSNHAIIMQRRKMGKTLVVYYSAQGHTKRVAEIAARQLGADIYEITPAEIYSEEDLDWTDNNSRASRENTDESLRDIALVPINIQNWTDYDTVILGYPIWWGIAAWPTNSFIKQVDFSGKKVIPFCTSHTSGVGKSDELLKNDASGGDWTKCHRFFQDANENDIKDWIQKIAI